MLEVKIKSIIDLDSKLDVYTKSNLIWILDQVSHNDKDKKRYGYNLFFLAVLITFFKFLFRYLYSFFNNLFNRDIQVPSGNHSTLFLEFALSHRKVLEIIKKELGPTSFDQFISYRNISDYLRPRGNTSFIDNYITIPIFIDSLRKVIAKDSYRQICILRETLAEFQFYLTRPQLFKLQQKNFEAMLFESLVDSPKLTFLREKKLFFGNDTCYRAYILIKNNTAKSITVQHGIISNRLMYYSRSNFFLYWDEISYHLIPKAPFTTYLKVGFPLPARKINIDNDSINVLFILTCYKEECFYEDILKFALNLGKKVYFNLHPVEQSARVNFFKKKDFNVVNTYDSLKFCEVYIFDSTVAFELFCAGYSNIYPVTCFPVSKDNTYSYYFDAIHIKDLLDNKLNIRSNDTLKYADSSLNIGVIHELISSN